MLLLFLILSLSPFQTKFNQISWPRLYTIISPTLNMYVTNTKPYYYYHCYSNFFNNVNFYRDLKRGEERTGIWKLRWRPDLRHRPCQASALCRPAEHHRAAHPIQHGTLSEKRRRVRAGDYCPGSETRCIYQRVFQARPKYAVRQQTGTTTSRSLFTNLCTAYILYIHTVHEAKSCTHTYAYIYIRIYIHGQYIMRS